MRMNPEVKAKWVAALRSGEYKQGTQQLRDECNRFCCLGVLCNLHAQAHPEIAASQTTPTEYLGNSAMPHFSVREWAGLNSLKVAIGGVQAYLAEHNDGTSACKRRTFAEIADAIEAQL
jgi:hypothetical protein